MQKIFVGDVQGCGDELDDVLRLARKSFGDEFELWVVGDLVNRGPKNLKALERVRSLQADGRARYTLGNHEIALIAIWLGHRDLGPNDTTHDVLDSKEADDWIEWLRQQRVVETAKLWGTPFAMVHASVHPDWKLKELRARAREIEARLADDDEFLAGDPGVDDALDALGRLTRCRGVTKGGGWSSAPPEQAGAAWHAAWARSGHSYGVVYGHWALQGLHVAPGLRGLDTACVQHGRGRDGFLTAWVPEKRAEEHPFAAPDDRFWQVPARRRYYFPLQDRESSGV
ncbi:MAG: metallophosphoesterase [Proteobacteria bacterium]|nr:metallophosphoesterase [Pseudomonadota bacterium]